MHFEDKYHLPPQQSLFLAKKKRDENIYCGMKMENRAVTFSQTQTILNGANVPNVPLDDIQAILNMRDAWQYLVKTINEPITLAYLCKLNGFIARNESLEWGVLRTGAVGISGTEYVPPLPVDEQVEESLLALVNHTEMTATEKALEAFAWGTRGQFFWDGNKRTSMTLANKLLVSAGVGILTIADRHMEQFNTLLLHYYNTGDSADWKEFLYRDAIQGIEMQ